MSTENIVMGFPDDMWAMIVDSLIYYQSDESICDACLVDTRMLIDLIQQVLDGEAQPHTNWVDALDEYLRGQS